jgi:7-cyano-7-deazaguanine reductase
LTTLDRSPLGKPTTYPDRYDPGLLFRIARAEQRRAFGVQGELPFGGVDLWTAYEITWLDPGGKPRVAIGEFRVPCDSPMLVESKSLKLYLGSFAQEPVATQDEVARRIQGDLSNACGAPVTVALTAPEHARVCGQADLPGESIDAVAIAAIADEPDPAALEAAGAVADETLRSALLRARCPVTGQPDCGDVMIRYRGRYLVSYRGHAAFHESLVERMFVDILERCAPQALTIYARFLRRGGIDINPFRSNFETDPPPGGRTPRQ